MKVLITGGCGYIGTELVQKLNTMPGIDKIIILDNLSRGNYNFFIGQQTFDKNKLQFVFGDLLDSRKIRNILKEKPDIVFHLAAKVSTPFHDSQAQMYDQINHWGSAELVYALEDVHPCKVIYLSSASVYGNQDAPVNKNQSPNPKSFYAISKLKAEEHFLRISSKMPVIIFRCGNVYGYSKSMRFDAVINKFMFESHYLSRITIHGNGSQYRPFIHIQYLTNLLSACIDKFQSTGIFDAVEKNLSIADIADTLKKLYPDLETIFVNRSMPLRSLQVEKDPETLEFFGETKELLNELSSFRNNFSWI